MSATVTCSAFLEEGSVLRAATTSRKQTSGIVFPGKNLPPTKSLKKKLDTRRISRGHLIKWLLTCAQAGI